MSRFIKNRFAKLSARLAFLLAACFLAACASDPSIPAGGINDPYEADNRLTHNFNKGVDRVFLKPVSKGYGTGLPQGVRDSVGNFSDNLLTPNDAINHLLQGELGKSFASVGRFAVNSTLGVAGIFDAAAAMGIEKHETDFGETLHVWGAPEGPYVELPFIGPSTSRDTIGLGVDLVLNPFIVVFRSPDRYIGLVAYIVDSFGYRYDYTATWDSILYESADSYEQSRILFLQNRRFELGMGGEDSYTDPYLDPYEDPYDDF